MAEAPQGSQASNLYVPIALVIFGVPVICGLIVIIVTLIDAKDSVRVWRSEFQYAIEEQCPGLDVDIDGGAGRVYLDAYQLDYQWEGGDVFCESDGRVIRCNCRGDEQIETDVSAFRE
jgi:hypothetical protein